MKILIPISSLCRGLNFSVTGVESYQRIEWLKQSIDHFMPYMNIYGIKNDNSIPIQTHNISISKKNQYKPGDPDFLNWKNYR